MILKHTFLLPILGMSLGVFFIGQGTVSAQTSTKNVKMVTIPHSQPDSGQQMFKDCVLPASLRDSA